MKRLSGSVEQESLGSTVIYLISGSMPFIFTTSTRHSIVTPLAAHNHITFFYLQIHENIFYLICIYWCSMVSNNSTISTKHWELTYCFKLVWLFLVTDFGNYFPSFFFSVCPLSPPVRRQWGGQARPVLHSSPVQDENFHQLLFSQHPQQIPLDESRQYSHTSTAPRMLHPAAHLPQQSHIMVDLHDQVPLKVETTS